MKLTSPAGRAEEGALLPTVLVTCLVISITLIAYMDLAGGQHRAVVRSKVWNSAVPVAEAGVEEALTHLHLQRTNLGANGWTLAATGLTFSNGISAGGRQYYQDRTLNGGRYLVAVSDTPAPIITAQAFVKAPITQQEVVRTLRINTAGGPIFARGLVAKGNIEWTGTIASDSFDSQDSHHSTNGRYDPSKRKDNGSVGSVTGSFLMGGGLIYGGASIGPLGSFDAQGGSVGDLPWHAGGNTGVQPGHFNDDLNLSFPDVVPPFTGGTIPSGGWVTNTTYSTNVMPLTSLVYPLGHTGVVVTNQVTTATYPSGSPFPVLTNVTTTSRSSGRGNGNRNRATYTTNYTYTEFEYSTNVVSASVSADYYDMILDSGDYATLSIPNGTKALVRGNARLYVTSTIDMQGQSSITIATTGTLNLYANDDATLAGNGVINTTADATRFAFWGTPNCTNIQLGGNAEFTGTIYAPQAHLHAGGGGNNQYDIVGSAIVGSAKFNGHFLFHYDENLGKNGPREAFVVTHWSEI